MSGKEEKLRDEIERQRQKIDESIRREEHEDSYRESYRDITKMQAPDKWPDPPGDDKETSND